jgi:spoIIIJ-associated protein
MDREARPGKHNAEFSGKTVEEALEGAVEALGLPVGAFQYQVMRDSTRSFLGFVRTGEVTIRVSWDDDVPIKPTPHAESVAEVTAPAVVSEPSVPEPVLVSQTARQDPDVDEDTEATGSLEGNPPGLEAVSLEILTTLLDKMGTLAAVEVVNRGGNVDEASGEVSPLILNVVGDDLGGLIGRRGETLRSLQFMTRLIVSRRLGVWPNLVVDVESYKLRREESLRALALRVAGQVRESRQPMALEPMPAHERRIVHLALRDDPDVYTESTGKEDRRKVQILPK